MSALEQEIFEKVKRLDEQQKAKVLEFIAHIAPAVPSVVERPYTARELMQLPYEERNRAVKAALRRAQDMDVEYFDVYDDADFDDNNM
jgi:hypothetical protein